MTHQHFGGDATKPGMNKKQIAQNLSQQEHEGREDRQIEVIVIFTLRFLKKLNHHVYFYIDIYFFTFVKQFVAVLDFNKTKGEETTKDLAKKFGKDRVRFFLCNVAKDDEVKRKERYFLQCPLTFLTVQVPGRLPLR